MVAPTKKKLEDTIREKTTTKNLLKGIQTKKVKD